MTWRLAHCLEVLREEVNAVAPRRSIVSDGTVGDVAHATRSSDHNPFIKDPRGTGVVRAFDVTHDPAGGLDCDRLAEHVRRLGAGGDKRVIYVIWNHKIASPKEGWRWRAYTGTNPHDKHVHISVSQDPRAYDSPAPWGFRKAAAATGATRRDSLPIRKGHRDGKRKLVSKLQKRLGLEVTGHFGSDTERAVKKWQSRHDHQGRKVAAGQGLRATGAVDAKTWRAMAGKKAVATTVAHPHNDAHVAAASSEPKPRRGKLPALIADFKRLQAESDEAWNRLVTHGNAQRRLAAQAQARDLATILLRIESKLETLVNNEEERVAVAHDRAAIPDAVSVPNAAIEGGSPDTPPVSSVNGDELNVSSDEEPSEPIATAADVRMESTHGSKPPRKARIVDLTERELERHVERLVETTAQSRLALIKRYRRAERGITRLSPVETRPWRR